MEREAKTERPAGLAEAVESGARAAVPVLLHFMPAGVTEPPESGMYIFAQCLKGSTKPYYISNVHFSKKWHMWNVFDEEESRERAELHSVAFDTREERGQCFWAFIKNIEK